MVMLKINDVVKIIPSSYVNLSKNFFNSPSCWKASNKSSDEKLMLGGTYAIVNIEKVEGREWFSLLPKGINNFGKVSSSSIVPVENVGSCIFKEGDNVVFRPKCSEEDVKYLEETMENCYQLSQEDRVHVVTKILNDHYIFIDFNMDDGCAFPFCWQDFRLVE